MARAKEETQDAKLQRLLDKYAGKATIPVVSSGYISVDRLLGDGWPFGMYLQFYSQKGVGKTTLAVATSINLADAGKKTLYVDVESALHESLIFGCGGEEAMASGDFAIVRPRTYEELEELFDVVIPSRAFDNIVVDSITALMPGKLLEKSIADVEPGLKARYDSNFLLKYKNACRVNEVTVVWLNQMRTSIDFKHGGSLGPAGSQALHFYSDAIINMRKAQFIVENGRRIGMSVIAVAEKIKNTYPFFEYPLHIIFGEGISNSRTLLSIMMDNDLVEQSGTWYKAKFAPEGTKSSQGGEALVEWVRDNLDFVQGYLRENGLL